MYINKIDELIDNVIDEFYFDVMSKYKDNILTKVYKELNFVKQFVIVTCKLACQGVTFDLSGVNFSAL